MRFPWSKREKRAESSYTDALIAALTANAAGETTAFPTATAALEACSGLVGRAFASARVSGRDYVTDTLTPALLSLIGRSLIRRGEILFSIEVSRDGAVILYPVSSHDIEGWGGFEAEWTYRLNLAGPSGQITRSRVPRDGVIHIRYATDPETPWRGYGPLQVAQLSGRLSAETIAALADESSGPRGSFLPIPKTDGNDPTVANLKADIRKLKGQIALVESMSDAWSSGGERVREEWQTKRFGAAPPEALVDLAKHSSNEIFAACGLSPSLFTERGDGTAQREAWRRCLFGVVHPLGMIVQAELRERLDDDSLTLSFEELRASDLSGRARAFQSMVGGGMDVSKAATLAGLTEPE